MIAFLAISVAMLYTIAASSLDPLSDDFIDLINSKQTAWTAGRNFPKGTTLEHIKMRLGLRLDRNKRSLLPVRHHSISEDDLPKTFDAREKWANCPSIKEIHDQGCCGSDWAISAVTVMTDRMCIYSNGTQHFRYSAQDLVSCDDNQNGCYGGDIYSPWNYWINHGGIVSGGFNSSEGCMPYQLTNNPKENPCATGHFKPAPKCERKCREGYNVEYTKDKHFGRTAYVLANETNYKAELFLHGPIVASFTVLEDFLEYKTGVYQYQWGNLLHDHAVKLVGWGEENGTKYWLCANSWNTSWGHKGYFKIRRGTNECGIESFAVAGEPKL